MEKTLLAHLVPKLTRGVEDAATEALSFILNKSEACRQALGKLLRSDDFPLEEISWTATQVAFKDKCRPDMAGYDHTDAMRLLVESKFWAGLGGGQACGYFRHLEEEQKDRGVLLFICPDSRIPGLWAEIESEMKTGRGCVAGACGPLENIEPAGAMRKAKVNGSEKRVMLTGWAHLLDKLYEATDANDETTNAEIVQLRGLADEQDVNYPTAFPPLTAEDLASDIPVRIMSLQRLVDETVERAQAEGWVAGAKKQDPLGGGYGKNIDLNGVRVWFGIYPRKWARHETSPLWVWPWEKKDRNRLRRNHFQTPDGNHFPVELPLNEDYATVLENTLCQLKKMGEILRDKQAVMA